MHDPERLYRLHQQLKSARTPLSRATLARWLEVSSRTVQRDIDLLRDRPGAPILSDRP